MHETAVVEPLHGRNAPTAFPAESPELGHARCVELSQPLHPDWERYVAHHRAATVFHTLAWRDAVRDAFGHADHYLAAYRSDRIVGVLPLFLVASRIAGRMLVSVPYAVGGGILADDDSVASSLFEQAGRIARELRCPTIDLRSERAGVPELPIVDRYVAFRRELPARAEDVLGWLPRKARAAARNGREKYGLTAHFESANPDLAVVWRLYTQNMRRLASLNYPFRFFESLADQFRDRLWVTVARLNGRPVAGLISIVFRDRVMPYFFGATDEARRCSAANFVYRTDMERAVAAGYRVYDFGRSRRDNSGSYDFKRFHGFEPSPLEYQRYVAAGQEAVDMSPSNPAFGWIRRLWPHLPLCVSRFAGARLSRHIPG